MDTPKTALDYIHSLGRFSGRPGLHRIRALCAALGDPQDGLRFVHLAGTNGKGSTACMTAAMLQAAGCRVGLYTSPYLVQFYERIRVNGAMIPDDDLTRLSARVAAVCRTLTLPDGEVHDRTGVPVLRGAELRHRRAGDRPRRPMRRDQRHQIARGVRHHADLARSYGSPWRHGR